MTVGSRSTKMERGMCLPAPVSEKNVLKMSSPRPTVLSLGIWFHFQMWIHRNWPTDSFFQNNVTRPAPVPFYFQTGSVWVLEFWVRLGLSPPLMPTASSHTLFFPVSSFVFDRHFIFLSLSLPQQAVTQNRFLLEQAKAPIYFEH